MARRTDSKSIITCFYPHVLGTLLLVALQSLTLTGCSLNMFSGEEPKSHARLAEKARQQGSAEKAVAAYKAHIEERLADEDRTENENPYFYLVLIGDTQLENDQFEQAKESYEEAERKEVNLELVFDRYRQLGRYLEQKGNLDQAIKILEQYQPLDPARFDYELDRLHKKLVSKEQSERSSSADPQP